MRRFQGRCFASVAAAAALLLAGCTKQTKAPVDDSSARLTVPSPPAQPVTAKTAFAPMFKYALGWSDDVLTLKIASKDVPGFQIAAGKAAMWDATFASPSKHEYRVYSYSIAAVPPDIYEGIEALPPEPWPGPAPDAQPIDPSLFSVDSDAAYQAAAAAAGAWMARNPTRPLASLDLATAAELHAPVWSVAWGDKRNSYTALVNAATGTLYKTK